MTKVLYLITICWLLLNDETYYPGRCIPVGLTFAFRLGGCRCHSGWATARHHIELLMLPPVQSYVRSAGVGCLPRPAFITAVRSTSYYMARSPPSSILHPITSASLRRPLPPFVALHLCRVSTHRHRLHCPEISVDHPTRHRCRPLVHVNVCLSSATTSILVKPLAFSLPPHNLSSCPTCPPARRHHISVTPESLPSFDLRHLRNMLSLHTYSLPPSQSHSYLFIHIYIYI